MAQLTITIPDTQLTRLTDAFAFSYSDPSITETPQQRLKRIVIQFLKETVANAERTEQIQALPPSQDLGLS